jgi:hypothetical protein
MLNPIHPDHGGANRAGGDATMHLPVRTPTVTTPTASSTTSPATSTPETAPMPPAPGGMVNDLYPSITLPSPYSSTPGPADRLRARVRELLYKASREMDASVTGPRGEELTVTAAAERAHTIDTQIQMDEVRGSKRHRGVAGLAKISSILFLGFVDFPIMLWVASSIFNVDWGDPLGLPLVISAVISLLVTGGSASALYHLGHNLRDNKNDRGGLDWATLSVGSKLSLIASTLLVTLISVVMLLRVYTEAILSGVGDLALPLALLVSFVMLISASLVFWTAFRDGSPEQDDLVHYSKVVQHHREIKRRYEDEAIELSHQCDLMERQH